MILTQESLTMQGPGATFLRGNHVWYNYARDYIPQLKKLVKSIPGKHSQKKKTLVNDENSDYLDIMMAYVNGIEHHSTKLLSSWREAMGTTLVEKSKLISDETYEATKDARNQQQAPEEALPNLLEDLLGPEVFRALTEDDDIMKTYGGANPVDMMFKIGDRIYVIDVTQSNIAKGSTHTSIGRYKQMTDKQLDDFQGSATEAKEHSVKMHFERSAEQINMLMHDIHKVLKDAGYDGLSNEGAIREAVKDMQKKGTGFVRHTAKGFSAGEGLRGADIKETITNAGIDFANKLADGSKRVAIKETFEAVMHILGGTFEATGDFSDIMVLGKDPDEKWLVGPVWSLQTKVADYPVLKLQEVFFDIDHNFFMDWFMKNMMDQHIGDETRIQLIEAANALWNRDSMYITGAGITTGEITVSAETLPTMAGYQVAGGAVVFEPSVLNEELGKALQEVINESVNKPSSYSGKTQEVLQKGMMEASRFSAQWNRGSIGQQTLMGMEQDDIGSGYEDLMESMHSAMEDDDPKKYKPMNQFLRSKTWVAPYIGVHYQGGRSQKVETLLGSY
tara:strand:- start:781 stop:2466 length:1686 start_codon:yes stop_codon:yes gene_type:complete